jgi:hypothetical protein
MADRIAHSDCSRNALRELADVARRLLGELREGRFGKQLPQLPRRALGEQQPAHRRHVCGQPGAYVHGRQEARSRLDAREIEDVALVEDREVRGDVGAVAQHLEIPCCFGIDFEVEKVFLSIHLDRHGPTADARIHSDLLDLLLHRFLHLLCLLHYLLKIAG